jgi:hypothetical protein
VKVADGFVAELTYGENVNWYRNTAAGGCVVVFHGREYTVTQIQPCSRERGLNAYPAPFRLILKAGGRKELRLLRTSPAATPD